MKYNRKLKGTSGPTSLILLTIVILVICLVSNQII